MSDKNILIIDNSLDILMGMQKMLIKEGYKNVDGASNKTEVNIRIKSKKYDLVFVDMIMPGINGVDIIREILKLSSGAYLVLTIDTINQPLRDKLGSLIKYSHNIHYLEKPFTLEEVLRVTQDAMKNRGLDK